MLPVDYIGEDSIAVVTLRQVPEEYRDLPLSQTGLKSESSLLVMLIEHPGEKAAPAAADSVLRPGDKLTVFGSYETIQKVFQARERFTD